MSGNTTQAGSLTGQMKFAAALPSALAIVFFVFGAFGGTWLVHSGLREARQLLLGTVMAALAVVIGVTQLGLLNVAVGVAMLSFAMGMMNTTESKVGAESVSLTFMTGDLHRIGSHLALAFKRAPLEDAQGWWDSHLRRAFRLSSVWLGFLTGAALGATGTWYWGVWVLLPPCLILLALAVFGRADRVPAAALRQAF